MNNVGNLCMGCMKDIGEEKKCPYCGFHVDTKQKSPYLPVRTLIANRYIVGRLLEYNGEGATYIGWDINLKKSVNIREFLPDTFTTRSEANPNLQVMLGSESPFAELRKDFEELWSKLLKLSGLSALINVTDVVEDYGTSYAIYDHFDGISLRDFLLRSKTGYISWDRARPLLMPILSTINNLHKAGIIHRGISPTTLVIGEDGKIKITGFSIAEARISDSRLTPQIFDGYAAVEQYGLDSHHGPWTDIYAFSAVLYRTLIGSDPIPAKERMNNDRLMVPGRFAEALPAYVINGLINALQILPQDRTKTIEQLRAELSASPAASAAGGYARPKQTTPPAKPTAAPKAAPSKAPQSGKKKKKKKKKSGGGLALLISVFATILVGACVFIVLANTVLKDKLNIGILSEQVTTTTVAEQVQVPNFVDRSYLDVSNNQVFTSSFNLQLNEVYSEDVESGYIISQNIAPDTMVDKGTTIILNVSKGIETIVLPNVVGQIYDEVIDNLTEMGFVVEKSVTNEGYYTNGEIISMAPIAEKSYDIGTRVILKVYEDATTEADGEENTVFIDY